MLWKLGIVKLRGQKTETRIEDTLIQVKWFYKLASFLLEETTMA